MLLTTTTPKGMVSSISPTLLPPPQLFPFLLPKASQPHPTPIPKYGRTKFSQRRDLREEGDILSDEEMEVEEMVGHILVAQHPSDSCSEFRWRILGRMAIIFWYHWENI